MAMKTGDDSYHALYITMSEHAPTFIPCHLQVLFALGRCHWNGLRWLWFLLRQGKARQRNVAVIVLVIGNDFFLFAFVAAGHGGRSAGADNEIAVM